MGLAFLSLQGTPKAGDLHRAVEIARGKARDQALQACAVSAEAHDRKLCVGHLHRDKRPSGDQQVHALADDQLAHVRYEHAPPIQNLLERSRHLLLVARESTRWLLDGGGSAAL